MSPHRLSSRLAVLAGAASAVIGGLSLIYKATGIAFLPTWPHGAPSMALWVSGAVFLSGLGLIGVVLAPRYPALGRMALVIALAVLTASLLAAVGALTGWPLDLERLASAAIARAPASLAPVNPLAPVVLAGGAVALLCLALGRARPLAGGLALLVLVLGFAICLGFLYGGPLFQTPALRRTSLAGGVAAVLGGVGLLAGAGPDTWPLRTMTGDSVRAVLMRGFLPFTVLAVLVTDVATVLVFGRSAQALGSAANALVSAGLAVLVVYYLARILGARIDRSDQALRESEERFRLLSDAAFEGVAITEQGILIDCNDDLTAMLGHTRQEMIGRPVAEFIAPEHVDMVRERQKARATERYEHLMRRKDGSTFPVEVQGRMIPYHGRQVRVTAIRDITERHRAEGALRLSEAQHRRFVERAVFGIYRSTVDGRFLAANDALADMLGYDTPEELMRLDLGRDLYLDPALRPQLIAEHRDAARIEGLEAEWRRKDGRPIRVRLSGRPMRATDGTLEGFEMMVEDVTERHRLEEHLRQVQRMEAIGQLAGGVAHDFNNLLTAVLASSALLDQGLPEGSPLRADLDTVRRAAQRGAELTQKLLAYGRRQPLELRPVSAHTAAENLVHLARRVVPENIDIVVQASSDELTVMADGGALDQMLLNCITNARDAMPAGGRISLAVGRATIDDAHRLTYGWGRPGAYVTLSVSDTGVGMDLETQRRAFEPFFTTKPVGQGTGLGLAVVYGLVKQHQGYVSIDSEAGQGTVVRIYLPAVRAGASAPARVSPTDVRGGHETILVVEDDEAVRRATVRVLQTFGYEVLTAGDGAEALRMLGAGTDRPDLILSDIVMPRLSGPQLLSELRRAGRSPRIVLTSGYTSRDAPQQGDLEPGVRVITKPWTVPELLTAVREALDA